MKKLFVLFLVVCALPALVGCFGGSNDSVAGLTNPVASNVSFNDDGSATVKFPEAVTAVKMVTANVKDTTTGKVAENADITDMVDAKIVKGVATVTIKDNSKLVSGHNYEVTNIKAKADDGNTYVVPGFEYTAK